jgi:hypothetical protein
VSEPRALVAEIAPGGLAAFYTDFGGSVDPPARH